MQAKIPRRTTNISAAIYSFSKRWKRKFWRDEKVKSFQKIRRNNCSVGPKTNITRNHKTLKSFERKCHLFVHPENGVKSYAFQQTARSRFAVSLLNPIIYLYFIPRQCSHFDCDPEPSVARNVVEVRSCEKQAIHLRILPIKHASANMTYEPRNQTTLKKFLAKSWLQVPEIWPRCAWMVDLGMLNPRESNATQGNQLSASQRYIRTFPP